MPSIEQRFSRLEQSNRHYRLALLALGAALAGSVMLGLQRDKEPTINGFSATVDQAGTLTYFRLIDRDTVQVLDTSRGDRWFWRRLRNWPDQR